MSTEDNFLRDVSGQSHLGSDNPWPGLLPFTEGDHAYFFGREAETEDLQALVFRGRLTVLYGLSGLGKSSLLQAGLFPRLRTDGVLPVYIRLDLTNTDFSAQIWAALFQEAAKSQIEVPANQSNGSLWAYLHRPDADFWDKRNRPIIPIFVFDQFEE